MGTVPAYFKPIMRDFNKKAMVLFMAFVVVAGVLPVRSEVFWEFQLGGMYMPRTTGYMYDGDKLVRDPDMSKQGTWNALAGFGLFIPLSSRVPLLIETGLRYRYAPVVEPWSYYSVSDVYQDHFVEIPLKLNCDLRLNDSNSLRFGLGAYGAYLIGGSDGYSSGFSVGIEPSVVFCHRGISFGLSYTNPLIYSKYTNKLGSNLALTFGIKFKSGAWKYIGMGVGAVATLGAVAVTTYQASQGSSDYSSSSSSSYGDAMSADNSGNVDGNTCRKMYEKWENRAREVYNSLSGHSGSASTYQRNMKVLRNAQKEMRSWRQKGYKAGVTISQSEWENKTVKVD